MQEDLSALAGSDGVSLHSGFPNAADERLSQGPRLALDLNHLLVKHPSSTYLFRISDHHWSDQGIHQGDVIVVDRALKRRPNDLVIMWQDESFILRRYQQLKADETAWGVVTATIHQLDRR